MPCKQRGGFVSFTLQRQKRLAIFELATPLKLGAKSIAHTELLNISDSKTKAVHCTRNGVFSFPFATVESVTSWDEEHVIIASVNSAGTSAVRRPGVSDGTEIIRMRVRGLRELMQGNQ